MNIIWIFFLSGFKFFITPPIAIGMGLTFIETFITVGIGGSLSAAVFYYSSNYFFEKARNKRLEKIKAGNNIKNFTRMNKIIVKVKHTFGIIGLAFLTSTILSIPLGSIISAKFFGKEKYAFAYLISIIWITSLLISSAFSFF